MHSSSESLLLMIAFAILPGIVSAHDFMMAIYRARKAQRKYGYQSLDDDDLEFDDQSANQSQSLAYFLMSMGILQFGSSIAISIFSFMGTGWSDCFYVACLWVLAWVCILQLIIAHTEKVVVHACNWRPRVFRSSKIR